MTKPLARQHSLYLEDAVWDHLREHVAKRGESASQFVNGVLRDALSLAPVGIDYRTGTAVQMEHTAAAPTHRPAPEPPVHKFTQSEANIRAGLVDRHGADSQLVADFDRNHGQ